MINYKNIALAIDFYKNRGYTYMEVPWLVSEAAIKITLPKNNHSLSTGYGELIGSAEQSFIDLMIAGELLPGKYVAATPCFRDDIIDGLHSRHFFKVELIKYWNASDETQQAYLNEQNVINDALNFYKTLTEKEKLNIKNVDCGFDIELNNIEIGSYGYRTLNDFSWIYGTGYADPRFSIAMSA